MNGGWQIKGDDDKQQSAIVDVARQAAEMAGCAHKAKSDVDEITRVLANDDHVEMWQTLQKFIVRYTYFIIGTSPFAGVPDSLLKSFCAYVPDMSGESHVIAANEDGAVGLVVR